MACSFGRVLTCVLWDLSTLKPDEIVYLLSLKCSDHIRVILIIGKHPMGNAITHSHLALNKVNIDGGFKSEDGRVCSTIDGYLNRTTWNTCHKHRTVQYSIDKTMNGM